MINLALIRYEIKRLIFTKKYFYMVLLLAILTIDILMRLIIDGFCSTAPFSKWSYTEFITLFSPILLIILILLCTSIFSQKEETVKSILYSAPISEAKYYMIKCTAIALVFIITAAVPVIISFLYYAFLFGYTKYQYFILPILLFMVPCSVFIFGFSIVLGKISGKLLYALIPFIFIIGFLNLRSLPVWIDLFGNNFLDGYGFYYILTNKNQITPYIIPNNFICSRLIFTASGILLFISACRHKSIQK